MNKKRLTGGYSRPVYSLTATPPLFLLLLLFLIAVAISLPSYASHALKLTAEETEWLSEYPTVVVGVQQDWKPFDFSHDVDDSPQGMVQDLLGEALHDIPINITYRNASWSVLYQEFLQGKIDILPAMRYTEERQDQILFTPPYINLYQYFFAHNDAIATLGPDLSNARLAIPREYAIADMVKKRYPDLQIFFVNSIEEAIQMVMSREADLLLDIYSTLNIQLKEMGIQLIQPTRPFDTLPLRMAVASSSPVLFGIVKKSLSRVPSNRIQQLTRQWLPQAPTPSFMPLDSNELSWLRKNPHISILSRIHWLPLASQSNSTIQGIAGDYLNRIGQKLNISFTFGHSGHKRPVHLQLIDIDRSGIPDRYQKVMDLGRFPLVLISNDHTSFVPSLDTATGKKLATTSGSSYIERIKTQYPMHTLDAFSSSYEALIALKKGKYDAVVLPAAEANYRMQHSGFNRLSISGITDITVHAALIAHQDYPILTNTIRRAFEQMTETEKADIFRAWGKHSVTSRINYMPIIQLGLVLTIITAISIYWNRKLSQEVRQRKAIAISVRQERDNFLTLFQQAVEGNLIFQDDRCQDANQAAVQLFGKPSTASLKYRTLEELITTSEHSDTLYLTIRTAFTECTTRGHSQLEFLLSTPERDNIWIDASLTRIYYLKKPSIYMVCRDVSDQKQLANELSKARHAAEASNKVKSDFIARVSHEIRTPLNIIIGSTHLLQEHSQDPLLVEDKSRSIQQAAGRLLRQIEDVLNFSRLEANQMPLYEEPINLAEAVSENADFFCDMASKKYLILECYIDPRLEELSLMLDLTRLNQILSNLVTNAIKYTQKGKITIKANLAHLDRPLHKADINISIEDTGVGIAQEEQRRIFDNFVRTSESENAQQEGSGLGLAISSKLATLMGGSLHLESQPGQGSNFTLRLRGVCLAKHDHHQPAASPASLPSRDRSALKQARLSSLNVPAPDSINTPKTAPSWLIEMDESECDQLQALFHHHISEPLELLKQNHSLTVVQQLARALQTQAGNIVPLRQYGEALERAHNTCDITAIERIKQALQYIHRYISDSP